VATRGVSGERATEETVAISGLDCPDCALKVQKAVQKLPGVKDAEVNFTASNLRIKYDPQVSSKETVFSLIKDFGYGVGTTEDIRTSMFRISGLDCPDCSAKLQRKIAGLDGVDSAELVFETGKLTVSHHEEVVPDSEVIRMIEASGYTAVLEGAKLAETPKRSFWLSDKRALTVLIAAVPLVIAGLLQLLLGQSIVTIALFTATAVIAGYRPAKGSISSLRSRVFDMNVLMTVAVIGAMGLGQWVEAATVMFLFALGTMLEAYTMDKTRHAIHRLLELAPSEATIKTAGGTTVVPVEDVRIGDIVVVKPGEGIPVDGEVASGRSSINQSAITGESLPVVKETDDQVFAGTLNLEGYLEIKCTKLSGDTKIAHIIHLVEDAQAKKAPSQRFIDKFSVYYTPIVIGIALTIAIIPPLAGQPFITWFYRALVLLVIACPCALVISTPVSIAAAIGAASRSGVLVKGGAYLEAVGQASAIVFDKTGTLTTGRLSVTDVVPLNGYKEDEIVKLSAAMESRSGHPLAEAIIRYAGEQGLGFREPYNFESLPGRGLKADFGGITYYIGNPRLFEEISEGINMIDPEVDPLIFALQREGKTVFILGTGEKLLGIVAVADRLREDARQTVKQLRSIGITNIVMLTGDNADTAKEIASQVGIDDYRSELLPEDKVKAIESLSDKYGRVVMIGDGVNDAPALSRADVGIAMGAIGSDIALETADIALMADRLHNVPYTINLSRRALRIIKQNVAASIMVKLAFIFLAVIGAATLWMAVFADTGISLLVILNGMRLFTRKS